MSDSNAYAPGWPGLAPRWTSSAKTGVGTAINRNSRVWFTLSHGIVNEIYYPRVDTACTRGLLVTDGKGFISEEKRDCRFEISPVSPGVPAYRLINTENQDRYRVEKEIFADRYRSVILQKIRFAGSHYELETGNRQAAEELLRFFELSNNGSRLLPEQLWDGPDICERELFFGKPSGAACPLVWAHSQYIKLVRSLQDGRIFDQPAQTVKRYRIEQRRAIYWSWRFNNKCRKMPASKTLGIELPAPAWCMQVLTTGRRPRTSEHVTLDWESMSQTCPQPASKPAVTCFSPSSGPRLTTRRAPTLWSTFNRTLHHE